jgi:PKHD-type hydroxylase
MQTPTQFIHIPGLLSHGQIEEIEALIRASNYEDGGKTAGGAALLVKKNEQLEKGHSKDRIAELVTAAMNANPLFMAGAMPARIYPPIVSRYRTGMTYGWHVDGPIMGTDPPVRTDLACTIFLADPTTYIGGELVVTGPFGNMPFKLPKGDAILYPANTIHGVAEITAGERIAIVTWIQSRIREPQKREILFQMQYLMAKHQGADPLSTESMWATQVYSNLMRMWAEV